MIDTRVIKQLCVIKETNRYIFDKVLKETMFTGCQCFKDCDCGSDFQREEFECYRVRKFKLNDEGYMKTKTFKLSELDKAKDYCILLIKTKYEYLKHN